MLIRLACSWTHQRALDEGHQRPFDIRTHDLQVAETERDRSLEPYGRHILGVLTAWYPLEYEMLEMLCLGHDSDFDELAAQEPEMKEHLLGYGLVDRSDGHTLSNAMIADFVRRSAVQRKAAARSNTAARVSAQLWSTELEQLSDAVVHSRTYCQELAETLGLPQLFSDDKVRVGAKMADLRVAPLSTDREAFEVATSTIQQLFWDAVRQDLRTAMKSDYPALFEVSNRARCLRHWLQHPDLRDAEVREVVVRYLQTLLNGYPTNSDDWARLHIDLMRDLISALNDTQQRMFTRVGTRRRRR